jgi:hypothetical protein
MRNERRARPLALDQGGIGSSADGGAKRWRSRVPVPLPESPRSKGFAERSVDWLGLWSLSIGFAAAFMAAVVYFTAGDQVGAALVLFGAAAIIAVALLGPGKPPIKGG